MSNARSPRDVCSTTMGINGLISRSLAAGGPDLRLGLGLVLLGGPNALTCLVQLGGDRLDLGGDLVEGLLQAQVVADAVGAAGLDERVDVFLRLPGLGELAADLLVGDLDAELVGDRLEHELAGDRLRRLRAQPLLEHLRRLAGELEVRVGIDAARLELPREAGEQLARARLDQRAARHEVRRLDERIGGGGTEDAFDLVLDLAAEPGLDVAAQVVERVE